jgi:hypothetical protein
LINFSATAQKSNIQTSRYRKDLYAAKVKNRISTVSPNMFGAVLTFEIALVSKLNETQFRCFLLFEMMKSDEPPF